MMCGRFALYSSVNAIMAYADRLAADDAPSYNITPGSSILTISRDGDSRILKRRIWGLVPFWAKDKKIGTRLINARSESLTDKPSFKYAFQKRRCLVVADGFFEWRKRDKQPFYIVGKGLLFFAGLWERWTQPDGTPLETTAIITTPANATMEPLHHRMPVILDAEQAQLWLHPSPSWIALHSLLESTAMSLSMHPVSKEINSPANNHPGLLEEVNMGLF